MSGVAAKRGDLVVVEVRHRDYVSGEGAREYSDFTVGVVTSVTRDGQVRMFRRAGNFEREPDWTGKRDRGEELRPGTFARALVMSAGKVQVAAALAVAACHVWDGHEDHAKAFGSLDEVRAALRPCVVWEGVRRAGLDDAAAVWEQSRRAAGPKLTAALDVAYADRAGFLAMSAEYHADVAAANEAFRSAVAGVPAA